MFENNPTLKNRTKCGKLSLPYCGPNKVIELNYLARMAKLEVIQGKNKWVHMRWLTHAVTLKHWLTSVWNPGTAIIANVVHCRRFQMTKMMLRICKLETSS